MDRKILHLDMDAFYAAIEERDNPDLKGKPVIVGALPGTRGVVSTCNYIAREYGIHSAMSVAEAYKRCPKGEFIIPNFQKYHEASEIVHGLMSKYTDIVEYVSLDEGYMDVTGSEFLFGEAGEIGRRLKEEVFVAVGTTCSVGLGYSMMSAKMASEENKPNGYFEIRTPEEFRTLIYHRPIGVILGVGKKTVARLKSFGIETVEQFLNTPPEITERYLGKNSAYALRQAVLGIDKREVTPDSQAKSIGKETTFQKDVETISELEDALKWLSEQVSNRLRRKKLWGRTVTLKIKYSDLRQITRAKSGLLTNRADEIYKAARSSMTNDVLNAPIRLIGVTVSHLTDSAYEQISFEDNERDRKKGKIEKLVFDINSAYGEKILKKAKDIFYEEE